MKEIGIAGDAGAPVFHWGDRLCISSTAVHIQAVFAAAMAA